jgi:hypothetical protein
MHRTQSNLGIEGKSVIIHGVLFLLQDATDEPGLARICSPINVGKPFAMNPSEKANLRNTGKTSFVLARARLRSDAAAFLSALCQGILI